MKKTGSSVLSALLRKFISRSGGAVASATAVVTTACTTQGPPAMFPAGDYFYVGGSYAEGQKGKEYGGQMYVQHFAPATRRFPYPVVMIHGAGQTGNNFLGTPDGRPGWAKYFVDSGFEVYVVDQPARGRSNTAASYGSYQMFPLDTAMYLLSVSPFPQSRLHNQWPGGAPKPGNPWFDQFMGQQSEFLVDGTLTERLNLAANEALSAKIGPAVYLTHSQSGPFGWALADAHPEAVKGLVAVEPNGPPFRDVSFKSGNPWWEDRPGLARPYGLTRLPLRFDPPLGPEGFQPVRQTAPDFADAVTCWMQPEPARKLPRLAGTPIMIMTGEASFRATYDHCTSKFLTQAGVPSTHIRLEDKGVKGNSHMMMLELNNAQSAQVIMDWLTANVK